MDNPTSEVWLRPARFEEDRAIKQLVRRARINPLGLNWERFTVAVDGEQRIVGCVQLKPHADGSVELASLVVDETWRLRGVARKLVEQAKENRGDTLWLMCESSLVPFYEQFDFCNMQQGGAMPPYFRRIWRLLSLLRLLMRREPKLAIMRWQGPAENSERVNDHRDTRNL